MENHNQEIDDDALNFFNAVQNLPKDKMMDLVYHAIINKKQGALKGNSTREEKIEALNFIISWFESLEEYEKCVELKKILQEICL
jgi:hypothetical protein